MRLILWLLIFAAFGANAQPKYGYIDAKGEVMIPFEYERLGHFVDGFAWVVKEGKHGMINRKNEVVIPIEYDQLSYGSGSVLIHSFNEGVWGLCKGGLCGFIDKKGVEVIPFIYEAVYPFVDGSAWVKQYGYWGLIDKDMNELTAFKYKSVGNMMGNSFICSVKEDKKYGLVNRKGETILPSKFRFERLYGIGRFEDGLAKWIKDYKFGVVNEDYEIVIPCEYDYIGTIKDGLISAGKDGKYLFIDYEGNEVFTVPRNLGIAGVWGEGRIPVEDKVKKKDGFLDYSGEMVIPCKYGNVMSFKDGYCRFSDENGGGYLDVNGKEYPTDFFGVKKEKEYNRGLKVLRKDKKYGFEDEQGNMAIPYKYATVNPREGFTKSNFLEAQIDFKYFIINTKGERISSLHDSHRQTWLLDDGTRWIPQMNGKYGYLDSLWNQIIPPIFNSVSPKDDGWILASLDDPALLTQQKVIKKCIANRINNPKLPNPEIVISPMPFAGESLAIRVLELEKVWVVKQVGEKEKPKFKDITFAKSDGDIQTQLAEYFKVTALVSNKEESCTCESIDWKKADIPDNRLSIEMKYIEHTIEGTNLLVKMKYVNNSSEAITIYRPLLENGGVWSDTPFYRTMMDKSIEECMFPPSMQPAQPPNYFATYVIEAGEEQVFQMRFNQYKKSICSATDELIFQLRYTFPQRFTDQQKLSDTDFYNRMNAYKLDIVSEPIRVPLSN